jgi:hypothetical protein
MAGRPRGTTKDPNRRRVINPNGRMIDYEGRQYYELIKKGYKLNNSNNKLIIDENYTPQEVIKRPRGRPKTAILSYYEKVKNPESGRLIKTNTQYFRKLAKKYDYDEVKNEFLMHVLDPKNPNKKLVKNDETFNKYTKRGYIYDKKENSFIIPSKRTKKALDGEVKSYEFSIVNEADPLVQMKELESRVKTLLNIYLKKFNGVKFHIGFTIEFTKITIDDEIDKKRTYIIISKIYYNNS